MNRLQRTKVNGLEPATVAAQVHKVKTFMAEIESIRLAHASERNFSYIFGTNGPTALDAHLVVFIKRMRDVDRADLIPEGMGAWADVLMEAEEWKGVMGGREGTMWMQES